jgi:hypothetical protein
MPKDDDDSGGGGDGGSDDDGVNGDDVNDTGSGGGDVVVKRDAPKAENPPPPPASPKDAETLPPASKEDAGKPPASPREVLNTTKREPPSPHKTDSLQDLEASNGESETGKKEDASDGTSAESDDDNEDEDTPPEGLDDGDDSGTEDGDDAKDSDFEMDQKPVRATRGGRRAAVSYQEDSASEPDQFDDDDDDDDDDESSGEDWGKKKKRRPAKKAKPKAKAKPAAKKKRDGGGWRGVPVKQPRKKKAAQKRKEESDPDSSDAEFEKLLGENGYDVGDGEVVVKEKPLIERILGRRRASDGEDDDTKNTEDPLDMEVPSDVEDEGFQYLVKWKDKSHRHCEWLAPSIIVADAPPSGKRKIVTFYNNQAKMEPEDDLLQAGEHFDPSYLEVERIIGATKDQMLTREQRERMRWTDGCFVVLKSVINFRKNRFKYSDPFMQPVDPVEDGVPEYLDIIKNPMDLGQVKDKLQSEVKSEQYVNESQFCKDVRLVFDNCRLFNKEEDNDVRVMGDTLSDLFEAKYATWVEDERERLADADNHKDDDDDDGEFMVKWKGLSYTECTWEKESAIDDDNAIAQ